MKMAKIFAIMFMLILAVFCFNGPFALGKIGSGNAAPEAQSDGSDILTFLKFTVITSVVL